MGEPSRTETPRDELKRRILATIERAKFDNDGHVVSDEEAAADAIVKLFWRVGERHRDADMTKPGDHREQIIRSRFIVAELAREAEPERIEGAWRG